MLIILRFLKTNTEKIIGDSKNIPIPTISSRIKYDGIEYEMTYEPLYNFDEDKIILYCF